MANEISIFMPSKPTYAQFIVLSATSQWFNTSGTPAYEDYNASNIADYGSPLTQVGATPLYTGTVPSGLPDGVHSIYGFETAGAALTVADLDNLRGVTERFDWPRIPLGTLATAQSVVDLGDPAQAGDAMDLVDTPNATALTQIVDAILAGGDIDGFALAEVCRLMLAIAVGKLGVTDGGNTNTFRAADDSKDRVVATVNSSGERTAITLDATP